MMKGDGTHGGEGRSKWLRTAPPQGRTEEGPQQGASPSSQRSSFPTSGTRSRKDAARLAVVSCHHNECCSSTVRTPPGSFPMVVVKACSVAPQENFGRVIHASNSVLQESGWPTGNGSICGELVTGSPFSVVFFALLNINHRS